MPNWEIVMGDNGSQYLQAECQVMLPPGTEVTRQAYLTVQDDLEVASFTRQDFVDAVVQVRSEGDSTVVGTSVADPQISWLTWPDPYLPPFTFAKSSTDGYTLDDLAKLRDGWAAANPSYGSGRVMDGMIRSVRYWDQNWNEIVPGAAQSAPPPELPKGRFQNLDWEA